MMETIKRGSVGHAVKMLQEILRKLTISNDIIVDGIFGLRTEQAVKVFQRKNHLTDDGIVGPKTWAALGVNSNGVMQSVVFEQTDGSQLRLKRSARTITELIVHCTATPEGQNKTVAKIRDEHMAPVSKGGRGFSDIGYHYVIYRDGTIHEGRNISTAGAHCTGHNANSIGIAYVGGLENKMGVPYVQLKPKDTRTLKQKLALLNLLEALKMMYPKAKIYGHRDFAKKACPSFDAKNEYRNI